MAGGYIWLLLEHGNRGRDAMLKTLINEEQRQEGKTKEKEIELVVCCVDNVG